ncbi:tyrosine-type recombinase/integrase [Nibribacter ruber]|uniref:Tyrosine-type recombinase/integrase n=1 Tax=Nibribacter ruber TaxID=2698458 RepID=A0A6P1NVR5_9BACT|nr:site-specific integrase [Nibribacter ruber]QHL87936.1 tyrosine-type recombinase/integrase [Nibribacter ruber]
MKEKVVSYFLKDSTNDKSKAGTLILASFSYFGKRLKMTTGLSIAPNNWDKKTKLPKKSFMNYMEYKAELGNFERVVLESYKFHIDKGIIPEPQTLKAHILGKRNLRHESEILDFKERYQDFLEEKGLEVKELTLKKYKTLIFLITEFEKKHNLSVRFDTVDTNFEKRFKNFLTGTRKQLTDTVSKYMECLKVYLDWALKKEYHNTTVFKGFKILKTKPKVVYLTYDELVKLLDLDLEGNERLAKVRDMFCFQCLTGQRFSDLMSLRWNELLNKESGELEWHLFQQKGNKPRKLEILITPDAVKILSRYSSTYKKDFVFDRISNQKFNLYLKELGQLAGIDEDVVDRRYCGKEAVSKSGPKYKRITSHTARRTYVTISHQRGMDEKAIMDTTGHEDLRTLHRYLGSNKERTHAQMNSAWTR